MSDVTTGSASAPSPSLDALARAGHRSVFAVVEDWAWCPHCGLKIERASIEPVSGLSAEADGVRWQAVVCARCHARGRVRASEASD